MATPYLVEWAWPHETNAVVLIQLIKDTNCISPCTLTHVSAAVSANPAEPYTLPFVSGNNLGIKVLYIPDHFSLCERKIGWAREC